MDCNCKAFQLCVDQGSVRKLHNMWLSDVTIYEEDKTAISDIYKIHGLYPLVYIYCPFCGVKISNIPDKYLVNGCEEEIKN